MDAKKLMASLDPTAARPAWRELFIEHHNASVKLLCNKDSGVRHPTDGL
jgi:hypothetical protein